VGTPAREHTTDNRRGEGKRQIVAGAGGDDGLLEIDRALDLPNPARMYDYFLGGAHNFAVDREMAERVLAVYPDVALVARANRAFVRRAVRFLIDEGIDQFLDIGSGIPTAGNVHEIAHQRNPAARVIYVDIDPIAVQHSLAVLRNVPTATAIQADARRPECILAHPDVRRLLDFRRPVAVLLFASLHFIADDQEVYALVGTLRDALAPGSYLVLSHSSYEDASSDAVERAEELYRRTTTPLTSRTRAQLLPCFAGLELVEPGLVYAPRWRPAGSHELFQDEPARSLNLVGVGRKPDERAGMEGPR
jgi:SAM-dependent methyltransferase